MRLLPVGLLLSACSGTVPINDAEWCGDMGPFGAHCKHTFSDRKRDIEKEAWDKERFGMACTETPNLTNWKASLEKLCDETNRCTINQKKALRDMGEFIAEIEARVKTINF